MTELVLDWGQGSHCSFFLVFYNKVISFFASLSVEGTQRFDFVVDAWFEKLYGAQVSLGSDLWVYIATFVNITDVTQADQATNSIITKTKKNTVRLI